MSDDQYTDGTAQCPACGNTYFGVTLYPADTASVWCSNCENRVMLADLREANADSRWYDDTDTE